MFVKHHTSILFRELGLTTKTECFLSGRDRSRIAISFVQSHSIDRRNSKRFSIVSPSFGLAYFLGRISEELEADECRANAICN